MPSDGRSSVRRRGRLAVVVALLFTALAVAGAEAAVAGGAGSRPRTPIPAFLLDRGRYVKFDHPDAVGETSAGSVNNRGQIVGRYTDTPSVQDPSATNRGYLLDRGRLTRLDPPGAVSSQAVGINNRGQVVGEYRDAAGTYHGYLWQRGRFRTFDGPAGTVFLPTGLNDRGQLVGAYENIAAAAGPAPAGAPAMDGLAQRSGWEPTGKGSARSRSSML